MARICFDVARMPWMRLLMLSLTLVATSCASGSGIEGIDSSTTTAGGNVTTTTMSAATSQVATTVEVRPDVCDSISDAIATGIITDPGLTEVSGITRSNHSPDMVWAHNDSGSPPRLWAVALDGSILGSLDVRARNVDWEDIALGPGPDGDHWIYLADIGDNLGRRAGIWIHRFPEPIEFVGTVEDVESLSITYPGSPADAEAFLVDPMTGDGFIITKTPSGRSSVFRIPAGAWSQESAEAQLVATVDLGVFALITAADISEDGSVIAVRTYGDVWLWERGVDQTVVDALRGRPCRAPSAAEPQGEAITLVGSGYITVGEGGDAVVYRFDGPQR